MGTDLFSHRAVPARWENRSVPIYRPNLSVPIFPSPLISGTPFFFLRRYQVRVSSVDKHSNYPLCNRGIWVVKKTFCRARALPSRVDGVPLVTCVTNSCGSSPVSLCHPRGRSQSGTSSLAAGFVLRIYLECCHVTCCDEDFSRHFCRAFQQGETRGSCIGNDHCHVFEPFGLRDHEGYDGLDKHFQR